MLLTENAVVRLKDGARLEDIPAGFRRKQETGHR
jgi:hypothetical protein